MKKTALKDKIISVIGANSDIAKEFVKLMKSTDCKYSLFSRDTESLNNFLKHEKIDADVSFLELEHIEAIREKYDVLKQKPYGIVVAAGYLSEDNCVKKKEPDIKKTIYVNYYSIILLLEMVKEYFKEKREGFIMIISSLAGERGKASNSIYSSSKAGISTYVEGLAQELFLYGVKVFDVKPGYVNTKMTENNIKVQKSRLTQSPSDIAKIMCKCILKGKSGNYYSSFIVRVIALILPCIPMWIYKRLKL